MTKPFAFTEIKGPAREAMSRELSIFLAAINVDTQFAVRRSIFLVRSLALPKRMTADDALREVEARLAQLRESSGKTFGRPWTHAQLRRCYWSRNKRFFRRPNMPMTPEEWKTYQPTMSATEVLAVHRSWLKLRRRNS